MDHVIMERRTKEQKAAGVDGGGRPLKTKKEITARGWCPHYLGPDAEDDIWTVRDASASGISEVEHRKLMNKRLDAQPFEELRPRTQAEILEADRESVLLMRECGEQRLVIAKRWGVTRHTVDNFFKGEDMKAKVC